MIKSPSHIPVVDQLTSFLDVPLLVFSGEGSLQNISTSATELLGTLPRDLEDLASTIAPSPDDRKALLDSLFTVVRDNAQMEHQLGVPYKKSGKSVVSIKSFCATNQGGSPALVVHLVAGKDQGTNQDHLEQLQRQATIGQLAAGVAHEFNNILTALLGWTQLAQRSSGDNPQASSALDTIESNTKRARQIAAELLNIARPGRSSETSFSPDQVMEDTLQLLSWDLNAAHLKVQKSLCSQTLCMGNPTKLLQVFVNLIRNAVDATPSGGTISVSTKAVENQLTITISDTGNGIVANDLPHIFEPFFSTKTGGSGTGLGLAISKRIIESYGGRISVESKRPGGTTFTVRVPCPAPSGASPETEEGPRSTFPPGIAVLVVDDEPDICEMVRTVLSLRGAHVVSAVNGEEALAKCEKELFDAAFIDFSMAGLHGHDLARAISGAQPSLPIVFMSGVEVPPDDDPRHSDFLKKPFDLHEIQCKLREIIDRN